MAIDLELFRLINGVAGRFPLLDGVMRLLVNEYFVLTTMALILFALWFEGAMPQERERHQRAAIYAVVTLLFANALVKLCNLFFFRPRPFASHAVNLLFYQPTDSSFPSNPAVVGFSLATAIWLSNRRLGTLFYILAALFAIARVYCGVHYPSDIIGGAFIGMACGFLIKRYNKLLEPLVRLVIATGRRLFLA